MFKTWRNFNRERETSMFRFNLKSTACGLVLVGTVAALSGCSTNSQEQSAPAPAQPTAVRLTTYPEKPDTRTEAEKVYDGFWGNSNCPMIHTLMSSSGIEWRIEWSPSGEATVTNVDLGKHFSKMKAEYDESLRKGEFPPDAPRDFTVALKQKCLSAWK